MNKNLIDLQNYRMNKSVEEGLTRGRKPLYISYQDKTIKGEESGEKGFSQKISSIRKRLDNINDFLGSVSNIEKA